MDLAALQRAPDEERIAFIKRDRWVPTSQTTAATWHIRHAFTQPDVTRRQGTLIWGPSNSGKSALLKHVVQAHAQPAGGEDQGKPNVLVVQAPDEAEKPQVIEAILSAMDPFFTWPGRRQSNARSLERDAFGGLRELQPRALVFDDLSNLTVARGQGQRVTLNFLRRLSGGVVLVCAGTEAVHSVLAADQQLKERFTFVKLGPFTTAPELQSFIVKYSRTFPLRRETSWTDAMFEQVVRVTDGLIGRVVIILKTAAILAVEEGQEAITAELLTSPRAVDALASMQKLQAAKRQGRALA